jgi:outer membrane protein assembly factor BamB/tetratricopeptide (TPR) repeat protein
MAFKGDLTNISLFDVFQTLSQNKQTGVLVLTKDSHTKKVHISPEGVRIFFSRSFRPLRLGEIFVKRGRITQQDVEILLLEQKKRYRPMGELLVESGKVTEEEVAETLRYHAEDEIFEVFGWDRGNFSFYDGQEAGDPTTPLSDILMDPAGLCLEAARRLDEMERLREAIPTNDEYYVAEGAPPDPREVGEAARLIHDALAQPNSLDEMRDLVGLSLHDTLGAIQKLLDRGLIRKLTIDELLASAEAENEAGELDRAAHLLEKAHALEPHDRAILERVVDVLGRLATPRPVAGYLASLGRLCLEAGETEQAIEHLEEALRADGSNGAALATLRDAYAQQNDTERVAEVSLRLARAQADRGELDEALETCRSGIEQAPQAVSLRFLYAQVLARSNRIDEAREEMYTVIRATEASKAASSDRAYELLANCYRLLLKIDPSDAEAEAGLRDIDRRRMLVLRRKKFVVRGGAAAALLLVLVGIGFATGGPSASGLVAEIKKAHQKKNMQRVVELADELAEAHPDSAEAKWAIELKESVASELTATDSVRRDREKALRADMETDLEEVRAALSDREYDEALDPVKRFLVKLNKPEMTFLRKSMGPQIEYMLITFLERVRGTFDAERKQAAAGEVQLRQLEGKAADLMDLETKLARVRQRDWAKLAPVLAQNLLAVAESPHVGKAAEGAAEVAQRLSGAPGAFANLDALFYTVRRERLRAEILDLYKTATTLGQDCLTDCEFDRARELFQAVRTKADEVIDEEPREHFRELLTWLDLRTIPAQMNTQIQRIDHVTTTLKDVAELRRLGKSAAAYRLMRDLVSENRLIQFEKRYKLPYYIVSVPAGAQVEVDGKSLGRAPCEIEMEIGQRPVHVVLRRDGFRDTDAKLIPTDPALDGQLDLPMVKDLAWEHEMTGGGVEAHPTIADGKLLLATTNACLLALDLESGRQLWEAPTGLLQRIKARPVVAGKSAYLITLDGHLHQIRLSDGRIVDRHEFGAQVEQDPAVFEDTIFVATRRPALVALRGTKVVWEVPLSESPSTPVVHMDGAVYVGTTKGAILVHDARTGAPRTPFRVSSGTSFWGGLTSHRDLILAGAEDGKLYAFDTRTGKQAWALPTGGPLGAPPVSDGNRIYLPARDGYVHVISPEGQAIDRLDMGYAVKARPALSGGFLYMLGSNRAKAFDTGGGLWWDRTFEGEFPVYVVASGQRIVVVTDKPWVYALHKDTR